MPLGPVPSRPATPALQCPLGRPDEVGPVVDEGVDLVPQERCHPIELPGVLRRAGLELALEGHAIPFDRAGGQKVDLVGLKELCPAGAAAAEVCVRRGVSGRAIGFAVARPKGDRDRPSVRLCDGAPTWVIPYDFSSSANSSTTPSGLNGGFRSRRASITA